MDHLRRVFVYNQQPSAPVVSLLYLFFFRAVLYTRRAALQDNTKAQDVLGLFLKNLKFKDKSLDEALRSMVLKFRLPGEAQQMDRCRELRFFHFSIFLFLLLFLVLFFFLVMHT